MPGTERDPTLAAEREHSASPDRMLQFFRYDHLPAPLQAISKDFCDLAHKTVDTLPSNPERTVTLRKLLEAKDAAVRTALYRA